MGAWGHGPFENDDASDWVVGLDGAADWRPLETALEAVALDDATYLDSPECCVALAAAEVLAILRAGMTESLPPVVEEWVDCREAPPGPLVDRARAVVAAVKRQSELRDLWEESESFDAWLRTVEDLERRLA